MRVAQDLDDPLLIAGDFNSTPNTWVHGQLRAFLSDAHRARGLGAGITRWIRGMLPVRIDYLYASDAMTWSGTTQSMDKGSCSDHAPVVGYLNLNR
jgi:endonuclease/exonuclease/phosphatase (EEP) superfamily protein YafD